MSDVRSNFSLNKIKEAGLKDQLRGYLFRLKFFNLKTKVDFDNLNEIDGQPIIMYTKKISGLPEIEIEAEDDDYYGFINKIPATPKFSSNDLTVNFRITEKLNPIKPLLDRLLIITQSQLDFDGDVVSEDNNSDITLRNIADTEYSKLFTNDNKLISDITDNFFFDTTVTVLEYNTRKPLLTYVLRNSWLSNLKLLSDVGDGTKIVEGEFKITFDFPEIYKVNKN